MKTEHIFSLILIMSFMVIPGWAQKKKQQDIEAIKAMCGCHEVKFNFAETFAVEKDYEFHKNYSSGAIEYIFPVEETKDKIVIQHILVVGGDRMVKHWRQDWLYENTDLYHYYMDNNWKYSSLPKDAVKGQWTQLVYQVDDSPRYGGSASWVHVDGRHYWEGVADAPLPRREYTKRDDYNLTKRRNHQEITDYGWVHEQDNDKIIRNAKGDQLLAREKGWNTYTRVEENKCQPAIDWWANQQMYWADVRYSWDVLFGTKQTLTLKKKVQDKPLYQRLFALGNELIEETDYDSAIARQKIRETIELYLNGEAQFVSLID